MTRASKLLILILLALLVRPVPAIGSSSPAHDAPEWVISSWLNGNPGSVADNRGRVILIDFFQLWCPGCRTFSVPLFGEWEERYGNRGDVLIVSIHTVFEGHSYQSPERLLRFIENNGITHPVGNDAYAAEGDDIPITMRRYRTGGTPHVVIVDKQGRIRFHHLGQFDPDPVEHLIEQLLAEEVPSSSE